MFELVERYLRTSTPLAICSNQLAEQTTQALRGCQVLGGELGDAQTAAVYLTCDIK